MSSGFSRAQHFFFFKSFLEGKGVICSIAKILTVASVESLICVVLLQLYRIFFSFSSLCQIIIFFVDQPLRLALNYLLSRICLFCLKNSVVSGKSSVSSRRRRI